MDSSRYDKGWKVTRTRAWLFPFNVSVMQRGPHGMCGTYMHARSLARSAYTVNLMDGLWSYIQLCFALSHFYLSTDMSVYPSTSTNTSKDITTAL